MVISLPVLCCIFLVCWLAAKFGKAPKPATDYRGRVRQALVKLIGNVGWAALAAIAVILILRVALDFDLDQSSIQAVNGYIQSINSYLKMSWMVLLLLCLAVLASFFVMRAEIARAGADAAGRTVKWVALVKALFLLLATSTFVGAEANASLPTTLEQALAARARLTDVQLNLFSDTQIALMREAVAGGIEEIEQENATAAQTVAAYNSSASLVHPALAASEFDPAAFRTQARRDPFQPVPTADAQELATQAAALSDAVRNRAAEDKLVKDIVKIMFGRTGIDELKRAYLGLGNPILDSILGAFLDSATIEPLRDLAARQANRVLHGEINLRGAFANLRQAGRSAASRIRERWVGLHAPELVAGFGTPNGT